MAGSNGDVSVDDLFAAAFVRSKGPGCHRKESCQRTERVCGAAMSILWTVVNVGLGTVATTVLAGVVLAGAIVPCVGSCARRERQLLAYETQRQTEEARKNYFRLPVGLATEVAYNLRGVARTVTGAADAWERRHGLTRRRLPERTDDDTSTQSDNSPVREESDTEDTNTEDRRKADDSATATPRHRRPRSRITTRPDSPMRARGSHPRIPRRIRLRREALVE